MAKSTAAPLVADKAPVTETAVTPVPENTQLTADQYLQSLAVVDNDSTDGDTDAGPAYGGFSWQKSGDKTKDAVKAAGGGDDTFYIVKNGACIPCKPFQFYLLESKKYFTQVNDNNQVIAASHTDPNNDKWQEHGIAVVLVKLNGTLVPVKMNFRGGQYRCILDARRQREMQLKKPSDFIAQGEAYKVAVTGPVPAAFMVTASGVTTKSTTSGRLYVKGTGTLAVSKIGDIEEFIKQTKNPEFMKQLTPVLGTFRRQIDALEKLANGSK